MRLNMFQGHKQIYAKVISKELDKAVERYVY